MRLKTPTFWYDTQSVEAKAKASALSSLSALYALGHSLHQSLNNPQSAGVPIICIGNLVAGGSGKTPTALAVMALIKSNGLATNPCFLSRGYGGSLSGPIQVMAGTHTADMVGDEPLLLAAIAPTIICNDRLKGAQFARAQGHDLVVMDDGLQNPGLTKDLSIVVIDGATGFGNGLLLPAGPLRTPLHKGLAKVDAVLLIGDDKTYALKNIPEGKQILTAAIETIPLSSQAPAYYGFCGIAHPQKFRQSLEQAGLKIAGFSSFPDHYAYTATDITKLKTEAARAGARLITTAKDAVKLGGLVSRDDFDTLEIRLNLSRDSYEALIRMIRQ